MHKIKKYGFVLSIGILFILLNIIVSTVPLLAIISWLRLSVLGCFVWYILFTKPNLYYIYICLGIAMIYSSLLAIGQFTLQQSLGGVFWFLGERTFTQYTPGIARIPFCIVSGYSCTDVLRPYATFPHPNVLGGFLAAILPLLLAQRNLPNLLRKTIPLGIATVCLTLSRSAIGMFLLGICLVVTPYVQYKKVFVIIVILLACVFAYWSISSNFLHSESVVVRKELISATFTLMSGKQLHGIGLGNFLVALPNAMPQKKLFYLQPVHNIYLLLFSETGVIGLCTSSIILVYFLRLIIKNKPIFSQWWPIFVLAAIGFVDHYPFTLQQGRLMSALFISLLFLAPKTKVLH